MKLDPPRDKRLQFEQTAMPHLDALYSAALRLARNPDDAQDLLQETVLRSYRCFYQFKPGTNCRAWLLTILYNVFRSAYRHRAQEQVAITSEEFEQEIEDQSSRSDSRNNPEELITERSTGRLIQRLLDALPADFREALLLVDLHELNYQEVAEVLNVPLGTVKSRVSRGRRLMRTALERLTVRPGRTGT